MKPLLAALALGVVLAPPTVATGVAQTPDTMPFRDTALSFEERARDVVRRMSLEEKVEQMKDRAPAIPRLSIPEYNWWNEALHGVARSGLATVFPQAIGIAATWNDSLMFRLATVISDEARAKHHEYLRRGSHARYQGLTFWSPNINIFRDPRWGRGQETFGEDPYLTGRLGVEFIRGMQGDDPKYFKTVATVKHFAVHSGPEPERHGFDAVVSERDLRESYLPHFEMGIRQGPAYSLMCAYNRVGGKAACGSDDLLIRILRREWGFPGFIVSDCGAIDDMYLRHKVVSTAAEAAALGVKSGTDLDCGRVYPNLAAAVRQGLITEAEIDTSLYRLFLGRMKLGMFDPPGMVRWARIPFGALDQPSHQALAREVTRQSLVLLKNANGTLPLSKTLRSIAVIGPNSDEERMLLGNYNGEPSDPITPLRGIREALPNARVLHALGSELAENFPVLEPLSGVLTAPDGTPGLLAEYFPNRTMTGAPAFTAVESTVNGRWNDAAPRGLASDDFSVRWTGTLQAPASGTYRLALFGTMRFQLTLDDSVVVRSVYQQANGEYPDPRFNQSAPLRFEAGQTYRVRVEASESYGDARIRLQWSRPNEALEAEAVRAAEQADAVVLFLGLTPRLEGEEMNVQVPGFRGGDRTRIELPAPQQRLLERVTALGKPTVLVLLSGSAVSVAWAKERVPAIVQAWYPGQAAGAAIADVLFGDANPAGRLPLTFYTSTDELPPFENYDMAGHTYRFFRGTPQFAFGHGLSYTTFAYSNLRTKAETYAAGDSVIVEVDVRNSGARAGDDVVQLYVQHRGSRVPRPIRDLRGYRRVSLAPGATRTVRFAVPVASLAYWDEQADRWVVESEPVALQIGASSADIRLEKVVRIR